MNAHDLEFIATNVQISASLVARLMSGKTSTDWILFESEVAASEVGPEIAFLVGGMEDFD